MVTKIIGLAGKSGSGKDVVADYICDRYGYKKIAVADAIRDEVVDYLYAKFASIGMPENALVQVTSMVWEKPTPHSIRVLLQWWGTEFRRSQDNDYWVKRLAERIDQNESVVISDVRLPDEMDAIRKAGGEIWFVERPGVPSVGIPGHLTEVGLEGATFDRVLLNDHALNVLRQKVDFIFNEC